MGRRSGKCDIVTGAWDHHKLLKSKPLPLSLVPAIAAGVSNTDTMPLCEFHKVKRVSFTHSRHFLFAQLLTFSGQPLWAWSPLHWVHAARCICLAFSGSSKGWMSLKTFAEFALRSKEGWLSELLKNRMSDLLFIHSQKSKDNTDQLTLTLQ